MHALFLLVPSTKCSRSMCLTCCSYSAICLSLPAKWQSCRVWRRMDTVSSSTMVVTVASLSTIFIFMYSEDVKWTGHPASIDRHISVHLQCYAKGVLFVSQTNCHWLWELGIMIILVLYLVIKLLTAITIIVIVYKFTLIDTLLAK